MDAKETLLRADEAVNQEMLRALVNNFGRRYSGLLGIDVESGDGGEIFKWFLASILFGAPIREASAIKTYRCFEKYEVLTPRKIVETGWQGLVDILDEGTYTRYDFRTSDKLLEVMGNLIADYGGDLGLLLRRARDHPDLERRLKALGKGVGDVTVGIFLRELRDVWGKADPKPTPLVILAAKNLGIIEAEQPERALEELRDFWRKNKMSGKTLVDFETALLRVGKDLCRKRRCGRCSLKGGCLAATSS